MLYMLTYMSEAFETMLTKGRKEGREGGRKGGRKEGRREGRIRQEAMTGGLLSEVLPVVFTIGEVPLICQGHHTFIP